MAVREGFEPSTPQREGIKKGRPLPLNRERPASDSLAVTDRHDTVERFIGFQPNRPSAGYSGHDAQAHPSITSRPTGNLTLKVTHTHRYIAPDGFTYQTAKILQPMHNHPPNTGMTMRTGTNYYTPVLPKYEL